MFEHHVERRIASELETYLNQITASVGVTTDGRIAFSRDLADPRFNQPLSGLYWQIQDEIQISNIAVHPDYRGRGIGEMVMRQVMDMSKKKGGGYIILEVRPSNRAALSLYKKLGFRLMGIRRGYYRNPPEDAFLMGRSI